MIKGAQKQLIVIRTGNSRYFDEAYFVLRREVKTRRRLNHDILEEANRILEEHAPYNCETRKKKLSRSTAFFLLGLLCGIASTFFICLLIL